MESFPTPDSVWPAGRSRWRICVLPDVSRDTALFRLIDQARKILTEDQLADVSDADLHVALCPAPVPEQGPDEKLTRELSSELAIRLAVLGPFALTAGPASAETASVLLDLDGDRLGEPWDELCGRVIDALARVFGEDTLGPTATPAHLTIAYGAGHCDSGALQHRLRTGLRPGRAPLIVDAVHLVEVRQDAPGHRYVLGRTALRVPLRGRNLSTAAAS